MVDPAGCRHSDSAPTTWGDDKKEKCDKVELYSHSFLWYLFRKMGQTVTLQSGRRGQDAVKGACKQSGPSCRHQNETLKNRERMIGRKKTACLPAGPGFDRRMSREEINELPLRRWDGPIQVISEPRACEHAVRQLRTEPVLGFDTETRPAFKKGQSFPPALLQLATPEHVFLFQLGGLGLPEGLRDLLTDPAIIKTGVSLAYDLRELNAIAPFTGHGFVDLGHEAKQLGIHNHGLRGLCAVLLGFRISKSSQTSNWSKKQLTPAQTRYAATDAWAGRELYYRIQTLKNA